MRILNKGTGELYYYPRYKNNYLLFSNEMITVSTLAKQRVEVKVTIISNKAWFSVRLNNEDEWSYYDTSYTNLVTRLVRKETGVTKKLKAYNIYPRKKLNHLLTTLFPASVPLLLDINPSGKGNSIQHIEPIHLDDELSTDNKKKNEFKVNRLLSRARIQMMECIRNKTTQDEKELLELSLYSIEESLQYLNKYIYHN